MKKIMQFTYGSEPLEMTFEKPLEEVVTKLKSKVSRTSFSRLFTHRMVGKVGQNKVVISHAIPFGKNSLSPVFIGSFKSDGTLTTLSGVLRVRRLVQLVLTLWFVFSGLMAAASFAVVFSDPSKAWHYPLMALFMFLLVFVIVKLGQWTSRNDKDWLKENIVNAIQQSENERAKLEKAK